MTRTLRPLIVSLLCFLTVGVPTWAQQTIFSQNFQTTTSLNYGDPNTAVSVGPNSTQFNSVISPAAPQVRAELSPVPPGNFYNPLDRMLSLYRDASYIGTNAVGINRTTNLDFSFGKIMIQFDLGLPVANLQVAVTDSVFLTFYLGANFSDNAIAPADANIFSKVSFSMKPFSGTEPAKFKVIGDSQNRFFKPTYDTTVIFGGFNFPITNQPTTIPITIALNKSLQVVDYLTPEGTLRLLAPGKMDVWVSRRNERCKIPPTLVLDGVSIPGPAVTPTDFKLIFNPKGRIQVDLDNFLIRTIEGALPVELAYFRANTTADQKVALEWATASEQRSSHFVLQRSKDLKLYEDVAKIAAAGDSKTWRTYTSTDEMPLKGTSYYRLKQIDTDGSEHLYRPVPVTIDGGMVVDVYPNPTDGKEIYVRVPEEEEVAVGLYNLSGTKIPFSQTRKSANILALTPEQPLAMGMYLVNISTSESTVQKKLVVY